MNNSSGSTTSDKTTNLNSSAAIIEEIEMQNLPLTMYIILRKDLIKTLNWNNGSIIAQASHAATATCWKYKDHPQVQGYMKDLDHMHKVVLETKNDLSMTKLSEHLKEREILHTLWIEQPENIMTCIATIPYRKSQIGDALKKCQLYK